jgi:hypothetical protein
LDWHWGRRVRQDTLHLVARSKDARLQSNTALLFRKSCNSLLLKLSPCLI